MRRNQALKHRSGCPIGIALDLIGDPWSLLVVRDLMFKNARTFNDFLVAGEAIATNVLADRLARLEAGGIVDKRRDSVDTRRFVYTLTDRGIDLAPLMVELVLWSARYEKTDAPPETVRAMRDDRANFLSQVRSAWKESRRPDRPARARTRTG
jgi:DNA-binding HxlR family transcriptional regulator